MPVVTELDLPLLDNMRDDLRGPIYQQDMAAIEGHDGWLARCAFGYLTLDRESGEFFLRSKAVKFPSVELAEGFNVKSGPLHEEIVKNIISIHGDDHRRLRGLVNPALAPRRVDTYRPAMRSLLDDLFAALPESGRVEFISEFAKPYPSQVIAHVMGVPLADAPKLHYWSNMIQRQFDVQSLLNPDSLKQIEQAVLDCYAFIDALIEARRSVPGDDLITDLIQAEEDGDRLSNDELRNLILDILVGGVDTSQSQLAHAIRLLAAHPDQWQLLRERPHELAPNVTTEALRYEPITPFTARMATEEIEYRGVTFPQGSVLLISSWHANRDGVERPDSFDITIPRDGQRLLTFGAGIHYCVGANLARAEIQEGLAYLAEHVRSLRADGEPQFGTPSGIYGLETLPLLLEYDR